MHAGTAIQRRNSPCCAAGSNRRTGSAWDGQLDRCGIQVAFKTPRAVAVAVAVVLAQSVTRPLIDPIARTRNDEWFTAMALLVALGAGLGHRPGRLVAHAGCIVRRHDRCRAAVPRRDPRRRSSRSAGRCSATPSISVGLQIDTAILLREWLSLIGIAVAIFLLESCSDREPRHPAERSQSGRHARPAHDRTRALSEPVAHRARA